MSTTLLTPTHFHFPSFSHSLSFSHQLLRFNKPKRFNLHSKPTSISPLQSALSDPFVLQIAETLEDSLPSSSSTCSTLQKLRDHSSESLLSLSWPTRKDEPFRFTDTSFLKSSVITPASYPSLDTNSLSNLRVTHFINLDIIDGFLVDSPPGSSGVPDGVYVGSLSKLDSESILKRVSEFVGCFDGDLFWSLNGVGAPDMVVIYVPEGCKVENPVNLRYMSLNGGDSADKKMSVSNPRVLVVVEKGGEVGIVEEYESGDVDKCYWNNSVIEMVIGEGATLSHTYLQVQSLGAAHIKWTSVRQESDSTYKLVEISTGAKLSRHNLHIQQVGPDTVTELSTLHLSVGDQTQDLHSKLILDHPRGRSSQLHKCIVAHPRGQAVFDGNVRVNRNAQQTDAGQLTRSLLLVPQATVNVKPNLQIIADDVKCSHGAAISDLEEDQLFYFRARGIDSEAARKALILSFGAEVIERIPFKHAQDSAKARITNLLTPTLVASRT